METSYNDWPASPDPAAIGVDQAFSAGGVTFPGGVKAGAVAAVFTDLVLNYAATVEPLHQGWCWGYEYRPVRGGDGQSLSCHSSATALDLNSPLHEQGRAGTMGEATSATLALRDRYHGLVTWGGDFFGVVDEMHWEISGEPEDIDALALELAGTPPLGNSGNGAPMALTQQDIDAVAAAVMHQLQTAAVIPMLKVDPDNGHETRETVSVTRALQSAQTQATRAAYRTL